MSEDWDDKHDLLSATRPLYHNEDYWRFLVRDVWRIAEGPRRVVDFGRGFGWAGQFLMPMLAAAGEYTGLDRSSALIDRRQGDVRGAAALSPVRPRRSAMSADLRRRTGLDHNIGMKTPVLMHKAGLRDAPLGSDPGGGDPRPAES